MLNNSKCVKNITRNPNNKYYIIDIRNSPLTENVGRVVHFRKLCKELKKSKPKVKSLLFICL